MTPVHEVNLAASPLIGECVLSSAFPRSFRIAVFYLFIIHLELDVQSINLFELRDPKPEYHSLFTSLF